MARVAKALLAAALMVVCPEGAAGTIAFLSPTLLRELGLLSKKDHHSEAGRRLTGGGVTGVWINELKNNVVIPDTGCTGSSCPPVGTVDFFEIIWGGDVDITEYSFTQYDAANGSVVSTYKPDPVNFVALAERDDVYGIAFGVIYPSLPDIQGLSISKDCSGEFIECVSYGPTPFTGTDGAECVSTGVTDPAFLNPIPINEAVVNVEGGTLAVAREGFCPGGSWSLQVWTPFFFNVEQRAAEEAFGELGEPFPLCPSHPCEPAEPDVESCPRCKSLCEAKAGFDLEPYPHQACDGCSLGRFQPAADGPNCEPATGGWRCCVLGDFDGDSIYERVQDRCYCAGRRRR